MAKCAIDDKCIACGACQSSCSKEAISEGDQIYVIDPDKCDGCGNCIDTCPPAAIYYNS